MTRKLQTQWKARANVIERSHKNKSNTYAHHSNVEANIIGYLLLGFAKLLLLDEHTHTHIQTTIFTSSIYEYRDEPCQNEYNRTHSNDDRCSNDE